MDAPPQALVDRLAALQLVSPRDWHRAEAICRRLARDLPLFEEVWIDALLQLRRITPFQADALREGRGDLLSVNDYVLFEQLSESRSRAATYLARPRVPGAAVVLKTVPLSPVQLQSIVPRLQALCGASRSLKEKTCVAPHSLIESDKGVVLVSRLAAGRDGRSLLVRHGALPVRTVVHIARQICSTLADAHRNGIVHGDLRLENLKVTERNEASLVDFGVRSCLSPVLSIHEERPVEWYQGTAPERIGTCAAATVESDIYALGCLLWHLLAGRAPFPHGDRLAVLSAHRTKALPCIRDFSDVPLAVAEAICEMTSLNPSERPTDLDELQKRFTLASTRVRVRSTSEPQAKSASWATAAVVLVAICGAAASFADPKMVKQLFAEQDAERPATSQDETRAELTPTLPIAPALARLPLPDHSGVVFLTHSGPFAASEITCRGLLTLRGPAGRLATIVVDDQPLHLLADEVEIENVQLVYRGTAGLSAPAALAFIECQNLSLRSCRMEPEANHQTNSQRHVAGLIWRQVDAADATGGKIDVADCVFRDVSSAFACSSAPRRVRVSNTLTVGAQSLLSFRSQGRFPVEIELGRITLRDVGAVVKTGTGGEAPALSITASDSILDLSQRVLCDGSPQDQRGFRWQGSGVVTTKEIAVTTGASSNSRGSDAMAEGIAIGQVTFAGPADGTNDDSAARVSGVPRRAGQHAGVDITRLPLSRSVPSD